MTLTQDAESEPPTLPLAEARIAMLFAASWLGLHLVMDAGAFVRPTRGRARESFARQVLLYVLNVGLDIPEGTLAVAITRDRKTVAHALKVMEDLRDDPAWDRFLTWACENVTIGWRLRLCLADNMQLSPRGAPGLKTN